MVKVYFFFAFVIYLVGCSGKTGYNTTMEHEVNPPLMFFTDTVYDFGIIKGGEKAAHTFVFFNKGDQPVVISNVQSFCGCTIPSWTRKAVKNNRKGNITINYDTRSLGVFDKAIKIYSNAKNSPVELTIRGEVIRPDQLNK